MAETKQLAPEDIPLNFLDLQLSGRAVRNCAGVPLGRVRGFLEVEGGVWARFLPVSKGQEAMLALDDVLEAAVFIPNGTVE